MRRVLGAVTLVSFGLAVTAQADGPSGNSAEGSLRVVADSSFEVPDIERIPRKARNDWLQALAYKLENARAVLQGHKLVVTSDSAASRTFTYDDVARTVGTAEARLADVAAGDSLARRIDLSLPQRPNRDGDLKVEVTGGVDTVGVLLSKKM